MKNEKVAFRENDKRANSKIRIEGEKKTDADRLADPHGTQRNGCCGDGHGENVTRTRYISSERRVSR
jgi:hypothetical protein